MGNRNGTNNDFALIPIKVMWLKYNEKDSTAIVESFYIMVFAIHKHFKNRKGLPLKERPNHKLNQPNNEKNCTQIYAFSFNIAHTSSYSFRVVLYILI